MDYNARKTRAPEEKRGQHGREILINEHRFWCAYGSPDSTQYDNPTLNAHTRSVSGVSHRRFSYLPDASRRI